MLLCDADNLATIQSYIHKHPHELLDSVVKERFDQAFRLNRGRAFYSSLSRCQAVFRKSLFYSTACRFDQSSSLFSGGRIIQRSKPLSTTSFNHFRSIRPKPPTGLNHHPVSPAHSNRIRHQRNPQFQSNLLIYKNFQQRTAPEVVRIIGG